MLPGTVVRTAKENLEERQRIQVDLFDLNEEHHKIHALLRFFFPFWGSVIKGRAASWALGAREGFQKSPCHLHGVRNWSDVVPSFSF